MAVGPGCSHFCGSRWLERPSPVALRYGGPSGSPDVGGTPGGFAVPQLAWWFPCARTRGQGCQAGYVAEVLPPARCVGQISDIQVSGQSEDMTAKEKLLLWSQRMVEGYQGLHCDNFTSSWRDGRLFNAIIHRHK